MMREGMPGALPEHEREHCPEQTTQRNATQLTHVSKTQAENPQVLNAPNPVENGDDWGLGEAITVILGLGIPLVGLVLLIVSRIVEGMTS